MYGDYWKLNTLPFENHCDPQFFFRAPSHEAAVLKLQYVVEQAKGVALLVGGHGLGKTFLTRVLEDELSETCRPLIRHSFPRLDASQTLSLIGRRLGSNIDDLEDVSPELLIHRLEDRLHELAAEGMRPVLILDDAHLTPQPEVWQALALLLSVSEVCGLGLSLVMCGQPELLQQISRVPALNERVAVRTALRPFTPDETTAYIHHRLSVAGLDGCMFDEEALKSFAKLSGGIPRRINQLCDLGLLVGYADELPKITRAEIEAAAEELTRVSID